MGHGEADGVDAVDAAVRLVELHARGARVRSQARCRGSRARGREAAGAEEHGAVGVFGGRGGLALVGVLCGAAARAFVAAAGSNVDAFALGRETAGAGALAIALEVLVSLLMGQDADRRPCRWSVPLVVSRREGKFERKPGHRHSRKRDRPPGPSSRESCWHRRRLAAAAPSTESCCWPSHSWWPGGARQCWARRNWIPATSGAAGC